MAGANLIYGLGMIEMGMTIDYGQLVMDNEIARMIKYTVQGIPVNDETVALNVMAAVGPGGHYLGHAHTQDNFQRAFFMPKLFDNNSYEQWLAEGSVETTERALKYARALLSEYQEPELDVAKDEALKEYIARREREIPAEGGLNEEF